MPFPDNLNEIINAIWGARELKEINFCPICKRKTYYEMKFFKCENNCISFIIGDSFFHISVFEEDYRPVTLNEDKRIVDFITIDSLSKIIKYWEKDFRFLIKFIDE